MADADFLNVELVSGGGRLNLDVTFHQEQDTEGEYSEMFCISLEEETSSAVVTEDTATPSPNSLNELEERTFADCPFHR